MSLVAAYSSDESSESEINESTIKDERVDADDTKQNIERKIKLPSANELFASSVSVISTNLAKHGNQTRSIVNMKATDSTRTVKLKGPTKPSILLAPPQLRRPNEVTEDVGAWNTAATNRKRKKMEKGTLASDDQTKRKAPNAP